MYKIKSLNRDSISDDDAPVIRKEAQEENALEKYNQALKFQRCGNMQEAKNLLKTLLDNDIPEIENRGGLPKTMSTLKYSCYLNIGAIVSSLGHKDQALQYLANASELDKSDVTLWFKIGNLAIEVDRFKQAAYAFSKGLECNKNHWPTLDKLITLLFALRDTISCLHYISHALQLDPDYTRGLVLRKRIYEINPGTQEYYQIYNPDYIYDPPLNSLFDEAEGKELEKESLEISNRIYILEKDLAPKPLPVLPLSKPLQEYTWLALGQSIIHMHQYITENKLSFMSRLDLITNISVLEESANSETDLTKSNDNIKIKSAFEDLNLEKPQELENITEFENDKSTVEKLDEIISVAENVLDVPELMDIDKDENCLDKLLEVSEEENQPSTQNSKSSQDDVEVISSVIEMQDDDPAKSEGDNNIKDGNDSKLETEKQEIPPEEKSKSKSSCRRRRNSLSFLQPWAWHSKRKSSSKKGKNDKDDTIEGCLRRIIPNNILPNGLKSDRFKKLSVLQNEDSLSTMDLYRMFVDEQEQTCETPLPIDIEKKTVDGYFGLQKETSEIEEFWNFSWERCDVINLLEKYVKTLATKWMYKWPQKLKLVFIEAYEMYREHFDHPPIFDELITFSELKSDAEITLLYGELLYDAVQNDQLSDKGISQSSITILELICTRKTDWACDYLNMCLRLQWLKANIFMSENSNDNAIRSLNSIIFLINSNIEDTDSFYLCQPNLTKNNIITLQNSERLLKSLEMVRNLGSLEVLYENKNYEEVIKILKENFKLKTIPKCKLKMDKPIQIVMLLHALWLTNRQECFSWTEICLNEALPQYLKTYAQPDSSEHKRWSLVTVKCLVLMEACIKEESIIIVDTIKESQTRLVENLTSIICHQINSKSIDCNKIPLESVKPWILLHYILQREEHRVQAKRNIRHCSNSDDSDEEQCTTVTTSKSDDSEDEDQDIPSSISILFSAHEFLGRRSWCLESTGELLLFMVDVVLYRLNAPIFESIRDKIEIHLEQAFFCLYQHPSKKNKVSRHLADHNVNPLPLAWDRAQQLYEFYQPKALPEFDSYRYSSISNEMEQLLLRILALVPSENDPQGLVTKVSEFVNGQNNQMPEPIKFPDKVLAIYYLLGDYYLKLHDPNKGLKYFLLDLCVNPNRLDTWADMALSTASQLETKLNHCEMFKNESEFLDKARTAQICFKQSLELSNGHATLWIEYGAFVYMSHSFCSRLLKQDADTLSMEKFEILESQKEALLDTATECFTAASIAWQAAEPGEHDERWLHHYMLGKIMEKKKQDPSTYLDHYLKAGKLLFENNATYPLRINYSNPQNLSVEALEIHYRIHASILKYLELHEDRPILKSIGKIFQKFLKECDNGLFSKPSKSDSEYTEGFLKRPSNELDVASIKRRRLSELTVFEDVASTLEDILNKVETGNIHIQEKVQTNTDVVMILDSDDDIPKKSSEQKVQDLSTTEVKLPKIRVRNAQEIMDDMMMKCMENQPEYKSETETDVEPEVEKIPEVVSSTQNENVQKPVETCSSPSRRGSTSTAATTTTSSASESSDSSSSDDSSDSSSSSDSESSETESSKQSSSVNIKNNNDTTMATEDIKKLIEQCLISLEQCISRFPQNYKAFYRLTHFFLNNKMYRDLNKCRQLMLSEYRCSDASVVTGLFSDRKTNNFFNGVWRIPTSEIDRPGSFASHMSRCVQILMQVLRDSDDHKTLLDLCLQLRRTPDPDKIYIRDSERQQLSDQALSLSIQSLRNLLKKLSTGKKISLESDSHETDVKVKIVMDIYKAYIKVQKHITHKESVFSNLLTDAFKHYKQNKLPEGANVLEFAIKFCMQRKVASRIINTTPQIPPVVPNVVKQASPVQPAQQPSVPTAIKKSTKGLPGRPRGRPPNINKHLTGMKSSKMYKDHNFLSPTNPYSWQNLLYSPMSSSMDSKLAFNFMMSKYQEEFLRRYSQLGQNPLLSNSNPFTNMLPPNIMNTASTSFKDLNKIVSSTSSLGKDVSKNPTSYNKDLSKTGEPSKMKPVSLERKDSTVDTKMRYSKETNKAYYADPNKDFNNDYFKDRPGISITPIHQNQPNVSNVKQNKLSTAPVLPKQSHMPALQPSTKSQPMLPMKPSLIPTSPGKTLQQKLAEKQKRNPAAQKTPPMKPMKRDSSIDLYNQIQSFSQKNVFPKPNLPIPTSMASIPKHLSNVPLSRPHNSYKNLPKSLPSSLTIMKSQLQSVMPGLHTGDSGISISQVPLPSSMYKPDTNKLMNFRKPTAPKIKFGSNKLGSDITVTPNYGTSISETVNDFGVNIPMSLSVTKKDDSKNEKKQEDAVEIITIE